ncbi:Invasion protein B-like protein [Isoalcanivorax pacificus W11-5]|uniref:Invasion protein B-like protein n=1 Tax=Isoalcanivorax pacificus W11-5 TaxID=391936 RepID=A0A0B4XLN7_9GAMM|nr:invasion associated locus B family protein [Isoalcanivorax pacificus]AJD47438.1 Invasion protein B-like protein [Isoalcanivorax pacificus W11-5]
MLAYNNNGLKGRTFHAVMTGVVVILLSLAAAGMARADNSPTAPPAWQASCVAPSRAAPADCRMEQRLIAQETGQNLSLVVVSVPGDTRKPVMNVLLPNGLAVSEKVTFQIDDDATQDLPLKFCDGSGCLAVTELDNRQIRALERGNRLTLQATTAQGAPLQLHHSLADFTAVFGAIK